MHIYIYTYYHTYIYMYVLLRADEGTGGTRAAHLRLATRVSPPPQIMGGDLTTFAPDKAL